MSDRLKLTFLNINKEQNSHVVATFGIHIISMDMFLSKVKLIRKKDGTYYVAPPAEEYTNPKSGKIDYANYWWFGKKSDDFFQKECMKAIDSYCFEKNIPNPIHERRNSS